MSITPHDLNRIHNKKYTISERNEGTITIVGFNEAFTDGETLIPADGVFTLRVLEAKVSSTSTCSVQFNIKGNPFALETVQHNISSGVEGVDSSKFQDGIGDIPPVGSTGSGDLIINIVGSSPPTLSITIKYVKLTLAS